jgi:hypothetical protein
MGSSYGASENAGGGDTEDYTVWDAALSYMNAGNVLSRESTLPAVILGEQREGTRMSGIYMQVI